MQAPARYGVYAVAVILAIFGVVSIVQGLDGRSTVQTALAQERVEGEPHMEPDTIAAMARKAGLKNVELPDCDVAGKPIDDGASARCFAEYMRIDALLVTRGATYADMPSFVASNGKTTDDIAKAKTYPNGAPVTNPDRQIWVTATALTTALNTSYMAEQISLFGIAVGVALLLVALALGVFATRSRQTA